ncbi:oligosaccharide flippase family protein [Nocardioides conyzicola]|uniref:Lipopolysaccharide biosynthesis protein n=1 Tax=Nocardioides conyzicola TaxID=1651781 RepID=A0ABP8XMG7_9ACTN
MAELSVDSVSLARRAGTGAVWAAAGNIGVRVAGIAVTAAIARILSPADFGIFAIALAVHVVVGSLAELGMGSAVARSAHEPEDIAPTVTTLSVGVSLLLGAAMAAFAGPAAALLGVPAAAEPIRVLSICLVLTGIFAVPGAQLTREFRQDRIFLATAAGFLPANALLVGLALGGGGATSFAWSRVVGQVVTGLVMVACLHRRYRPGWRPAAVLPLLAFGLPLSLANLVNWSLLNADYVIIGRLLTETQVGVYMIAFSVAGWSTTVLSSVLNGVVVPSFGRVLGDAELFGSALASAVRLVALVAAPVCVVTVVLSRPLVETVFGATWLDAAPVLSVLAAYGALFSVSLLFANVLVAVGATGRLLGIQAVWVAVLVPAMVVGIRVDGLVGAAWAHVVTVSVVTLPLYVLAVRRSTGLGLGAVPRAASGPVGAALVAGTSAFATSLLLDDPAAVVVVGGALAVASYAVVARPMVRPYRAAFRRAPASAGDGLLAGAGR